MVSEAKAAVPSITCGEYRAMRSEHLPHVLLDVREQHEFDAGHIDGAIHMPRGVLEFKIADAVPDKNTTIVVQCAGGGRSALCGQTLLALGYTNVKNLEGGYTEWCNA